MANNPLTQFLADLLNIIADKSVTTLKTDATALATNVTTNGAQGLSEAFILDLIDFQINGVNGTGLIARLVALFSYNSSQAAVLSMAILAEYRGTTDVLASQMVSQLTRIINNQGSRNLNLIFSALAYLPKEHFPVPFQKDLLDFRINGKQGSGLIAQLLSLPSTPSLHAVALSMALLAEYQGTTDSLVSQIIAGLMPFIAGQNLDNMPLAILFTALSYLPLAQFPVPFQEDLLDFQKNWDQGTGLIAQFIDNSQPQAGVLAQKIIAEYEG